jgi:hypothetical protein
MASVVYDQKCVRAGIISNEGCEMEIEVMGWGMTSYEPTGDFEAVVLLKHRFQIIDLYTPVSAMILVVLSKYFATSG